MEVHDVCAIFPMMSGDEFRALVADIRANGQREPVWTYQGKVIDGRNRLKACQEIGVDPKTREWDGKGSLVGFVVSLNLHRRHLDDDQRSMCAAEASDRLREEARQRQSAAGGDKRSPEAKTALAERSLVARSPQAIEEHRPAPKSRDIAAKAFHVAPRKVQDAITLRKEAPDLAEKVKAGIITLPQAKREVERTEKRATLEAKAKAVEAAPPEAKPAWEIVEGDCRERLAAIDPGSVRLLFADPPYNIGIDYGDHLDDARPDQEFIDWSREWIFAAAKTLAPDGSMWVLINDEWADIYGCLLRDADLHRRAWIKWYESFGVNNANNFNRTSRHLFYCVKDPKRFVFNRDAVTRPSDRQLKYGDKRADPGGKVWDDVWGIPWDDRGNGAIPRLVGNAEERLPDFPTQLPLALLEPIIKCASETGDLVVDPFNGSGTAGVAAIRHGRRYLGIELSANFARMARLRLTAEKGSVHGAA
jgi:DNA modification methylase